MKKFLLRSECFVFIFFISASAQAATEFKSLVLSQEDQKSIALTIYNNNFALVRDQRNTVLPKGLIELKYLDVAKKIEPSSVSTRSMAGDNAFFVLEQSYRYQVLNRQSLLNSYIGRKLKYSREVLKGAKYEKYLREGILLSTNPEIVSFGDVIEIAPEGVVSMPYLPDGLYLEPTLVWLIENQHEGSQLLETSYISNNISWQADYTILLDEKNEEFDLNSWVSINNQSGIDYIEAKITLVAGEVNRAPSVNRSSIEEVHFARSRMADTIQAKPAFEYHQYSLPTATDIRDREEKQIRFINASKVAFEKTYSFNTQTYSYQQAQLVKTRADVKISFNNTKKNGLGRPLPYGKVRVYLGTKQNLLLAGEDIIQAKALGESVELNLGHAFDISSERKQTSFRRLGDRHIEASYEIKLHNAKNKSVEVSVNETLQGEWKIIDQSERGKKLNSTTLQFKITIPKNSYKTIRYTAQSRL